MSVIVIRCLSQAYFLVAETEAHGFFRRRYIPIVIFKSFVRLKLKTRRAKQTARENRSPRLFPGVIEIRLLRSTG
jgi:hypothetical protein